MGKTLLLMTCLTAVATAEAPDWRIEAETNFLTGSAGLNDDGTLNVVIEIPAGTNAKWEVVESGESLEWELKNDRRRVVDYLAYPANYGMVPRTRQAKGLGGDGDPLDVVLLGSAVPRGRIVTATPIGVLKLLDDGERDDKIVAVPREGPFADVKNLDELERRYPAAAEILETWFLHYKGPGRIESEGFRERDEAVEAVRAAARSFEREADESRRAHASP